MKSHVEAARKRLAEIEQEAEILRHFLLAWEAAAPLLDFTPSPDSNAEKNTGAPVDESATRSSQDGNGPTSSAPVKRTRVTDNPKPAVLIPAAIEIIRENGKPLSRRALHEALASRGLIVKGSDPIKALGTILWRAPDEIVQLEGFGYWPKTDQYRPANYAGTLFQGLADHTSIQETH